MQEPYTVLKVISLLLLGATTLPVATATPLLQYFGFDGARDGAPLHKRASTSQSHGASVPPYLHFSESAANSKLSSIRGICYSNARPLADC